MLITAATVTYWYGTSGNERPSSLKGESAIPTPQQTKSDAATDVEKSSGDPKPEGVAVANDIATGTLLDTQKSSLLRKKLLDTLRPVARAEWGGEIVFVVTDIRSDGRFAYLNVKPVRPNGQTIEMMLAGGRGKAYGDALLAYRHGRWQVDRFVPGASDVWICEYKDTYPTAVLVRSCSY